MLLGGCKPWQKLETATRTFIRPLPATFPASSDTANVAHVTWKEIIKDKGLAALIDTAVQNNWNLAIALQRIKAAQSDIFFSQGVLRPKVNGLVSSNLRRFGLYTMDGAGNKTTEIYNDRIIPEDLPNYFAGLQASWEVDIWGKLQNQKKAATARYLASIEGKNFITTNLIAEIANAYYDLVALDNMLLITEETISLQEQALEMIKAQKAAAAANELAVKQFETHLHNLKGSRLEILQEISLNENRINFLLGRYPQPILRDKTIINQEQPIKVNIGLPSALLQNRPDIKQAEYELIASKADVQAAKAMFFPTLNLNGSVGFQAFKTSLMFQSPESFAYGLFGDLLFPFLNRSAIKASFIKANTNQIGALYNYQRVILTGYLEVYNQMLVLKNLQEIYEEKSREVNAVNESTAISTELFKRGRANYLEVLITQQKAVQAKIDLVSTKKRQFQTTINLYRALGGGWR